MVGNRICAIALVAASATICSTPSAIASPFDGNWSVVAQTILGHCGNKLAINRGRLYSAGGYYVGGYPALLGGRISPSRYVQANAVAGSRTAYAAGRLRHAAAGDAAPWLCFRNRRASATNEMPNTIE
jgi:hypothetical protein